MLIKYVSDALERTGVALSLLNTLLLTSYLIKILEILKYITLVILNY